MKMKQLQVIIRFYTRLSPTLRRLQVATILPSLVEAFQFSSKGSQKTLMSFTFLIRINIANNELYDDQIFNRLLCIDFASSTNS